MKTSLREAMPALNESGPLLVVVEERLGMGKVYKDSSLCSKCFLCWSVQQIITPNPGEVCRGRRPLCTFWQIYLNTVIQADGSQTV